VRAYDLIAIDLDGTLLNAEHRVSAENRAALHRAHEAGWKIVLCTGRAYPETRPILDEIGLDLDAAITVFGAVVTDVRTGRTLDCTPIPRQTADDAVAWFQARGYAVLWLCDGAGRDCDGYVIDGPRRHVAVNEYVAVTPCRMRCVSQLPPDAPEPVRLSIIDDRGTLEPLSPLLRAAFDGRLVHNVLSAPTWHLNVIEAFGPQVNKWYGLTRLCRRWGLDPARTVAVGDDTNDIEMLRHAGLGVAMANARDEVKAVARRLTASHIDHGVAALLHELLRVA
jgi:hypothetical protein